MIDLSPNAQAILLLTGHLILGRKDAPVEVLTLTEYNRLAQRLREIGSEPADLLSASTPQDLGDFESVVEVDRLQRLLGRGFQLSQAVEHWRARAIWVVSRPDDAYPKRLKARLRDKAPTLLFGCGEVSLLGQGGLAIVGSRHADEEALEYAVGAGRLAARAGRAIVSGGAKGVDQAGMMGALEAGGQACGVLADSLEKQAMVREHRTMLMEGQLTLVSPYDPKAGFHQGNAMQRNKLIYALADAALVVSSDVEKGGTWAGAIEQLEKLKFVPVYVRSVGSPSAGLTALKRRGAWSWPNPETPDELEDAIQASLPPPSQGDLSLVDSAPPRAPHNASSQPADSGKRPDDLLQDATVSLTDNKAPLHQSHTPSDSLFVLVRELILQLVDTHAMKDSEIADTLGVLPTQTKEWLSRLVEEGHLEKLKRPTSYRRKQGTLI